jgi:hypothetical protein
LEDLTFHFDADPDLTLPFDADQELTFHSDAEPDPAPHQSDVYLLQLLATVPPWLNCEPKRRQDETPASQNEADPDPQHWFCQH